MYANFKNLLDKDLDSTFYNTEEFAEVHTVEYDDFCKKIPLVFDADEERERIISMRDHAEGLHLEQVKVRMRLEDIGRVPRRDGRIFIDEELYLVARSKVEYNEVILRLERYDE